MAFSLKTSRACTDMLSDKNHDIKFSKTAKSTNSTCFMCTIVPGLVELVFFLQISLPLTRNMNAKKPSSCIIYFPNNRNFDTGHFSLTLSLYQTVLKVYFGNVYLSQSYGLTERKYSYCKIRHLSKDLVLNGGRFRNMGLQRPFSPLCRLLVVIFRDN